MILIYLHVVSVKIMKMGKVSKSNQRKEHKIKMMVVPWKNKEEFKLVYDGIYSDEVEHKMQAMEKMLTWQSRALDKLPIAIESTMAICRACISHLMAMQEHNLKGNYLKLVYEYSMAIIRFVNNVTELGQTRMHRMPLHRIAGSFGIPSWIVEMRHNATHRSLPSLAELTAGADWILEWLREDFWDAQYNIMETLKPKGTFNMKEDEEFIDKVIKQYMVDTMKAIRSGEKLNNCYSDLFQLLERHRSKMLYNIMKTGFFIPSVSQLEELGIRTENLMNSQLKVPDVLGKLWGPLLNILHRTKLTSALVQLMVTVVTDKENFQNFLLCSWLQKIITSNASGVHFKERGNLRTGKKKLYKYRRHIPHRFLLQKLLRSPSVYTQSVIKLLLPLQTPPICHATKKKIYKLLEIVCKKSVSNEDSESYQPAQLLANENIETNEEYSQQLENPVVKLWHFGQSPWMKNQDIMNWERIPLGALELDSGEIIQVKSDHLEDIQMENDNQCYEEEGGLTGHSNNELFSVQHLQLSGDDEEIPDCVDWAVWTIQEINQVKETMKFI